MSPFNDTHPIGLIDVEGAMQAIIAKHANNYCGSMMQEHLQTGGKRLRATVTLELGDLFGVSPENALHWASAVELLHNATLIHDDIQDGDTTRRNQPTTWVSHGVPQAINAGDLGLMLPFQCIDKIDTDDGVRWQLSKILSQHAIRTVCGQSLEMTLLPNQDFSLASYQQASLGKTGAFFALPMEGIALMAGLSTLERKSLVTLFSNIGLLFQMQDDILDCFGSKGRMLGADICEGKVSLLVVSHLHLHPSEAARFVSILTQKDTSGPDISSIIADFEHRGALDLALNQIHRLEHSITAAPILQRYPELKKRVYDLLDTIMRPIGHLIPQPMRISQ